MVKLKLRPAASCCVLLTVNKLPTGHGFTSPPLLVATTKTFRLPTSSSLSASESSSDPNFVPNGGGGDYDTVPDENYEPNPFFITTTHTTSKMTFKNDYGDNMVENKAAPRLKFYSPNINDGDGDISSSNVQREPPRTAKMTTDQGDNVVVHCGATTTRTSPSASTTTALKFYSPAGTKPTGTPAQKSGLKLYSQLADVQGAGPTTTREVTVESTRARTIVPPSLRRYSQLSEEEKAAATKLSVLSTGGLQSRFGLKDQGDNLVEQKGRPKLKLYAEMVDVNDTNTIRSSITDEKETVVPSTRPPTRKDQGDNVVIETPTKLTLYANVAKKDQGSTSSVQRNGTPPATRSPIRMDQGDNVVIETPTRLRLYADVGKTEQSDTSRTQKNAVPSPTRPSAKMDQGDNAVIGAPRAPTLRVHRSDFVVTPTPSTRSAPAIGSPAAPIQADAQQPRERVTLPQQPQEQVIVRKQAFNVPKMESTPPAWADTSSSSTLSYIKAEPSSSSAFKLETGNVDANAVEKKRQPKLRYYSTIKGVPDGSSNNGGGGVSNNPTTNGSSDEHTIVPASEPIGSASAQPVESIQSPVQPLQPFTPDVSMTDPTGSSTFKPNKQGKRLKFYEPPKNIGEENKIAGVDKGGRTKDGFFIVSD